MNALLTALALAAAAAVPAPSSDAAKPPPLRGLYVRGGGLLLLPMPQSQEVVLSNVSGPALLAVGNGPLAGSGAGVGGAVIPEITIGYRVWGPLSLETILALPITLKLLATGTLASQSLAPTALGMPTGIPPLGSELGETTILPPILTATYRLLPDRSFHPYFGAGLNVMFSYDNRITNPVLAAVTPPRVSIPTAFGFVVQAGVDVRVWEQLHVTLDAKYIAGLDVTATIRDIWVRPSGLPIYDSIHVGDASVKLAINPLILTASAGWSF